MSIFQPCTLWLKRGWWAGPRRKTRDTKYGFKTPDTLYLVLAASLLSRKPNELLSLIFGSGLCPSRPF